MAGYEVQGGKCAYEVVQYGAHRRPQQQVLAPIPVQATAFQAPRAAG